MKLEVAANRSRIVVTLTLVLALLPFLYLVLQLLLLRHSYVQEIDNIQPRTARLLGMLQSEERLREASRKADVLLADIAYEAGRDRAATAAAMQRDVRELIETAGMSVAGSQILDAEKADGYDRLRLDITAEGNIDALDEALELLQQMSPMVYVESMRIKPLRARRGRSASNDVLEGDPRKLNARFRLFSLRLQ
ncbi:MAG: type II secretion system protein GspM [Halioglobus sp.]|nr:type II secretion system protein GspM [Halioglobus sp.]